MSYYKREALIDISVDADLSAVVDLNECAEVVALVVPTIDTANITFQANAGVRDGEDGLTFFPVVDEAGAAITLTATTGGAVIALNESTAQLRGVRYLKVATSAVQTADRTIILLVKKS